MILQLHTSRVAYEPRLSRNDNDEKCGIQNKLHRATAVTVRS